MKWPDIRSVIIKEQDDITVYVFRIIKKTEEWVIAVPIYMKSKIEQTFKPENLYKTGDDKIQLSDDFWFDSKKINKIDLIKIIFKFER